MALRDSILEFLSDNDEELSKAFSFTLDCKKCVVREECVAEKEVHECWKTIYNHLDDDIEV